MKKTLALLALTTALTVPALASATPVTFTVNLSRYGGDGAYLALYVTDSSGAYAGTLWVAGGRSKYYRHLTSWYRETNGSRSEINGITGASIGQGRSLEVTLDLQDALFDAGYTLQVDAAVEDRRESPREVSVPLTSAGNGRPQSGRTYINTVTYSY